MVKSCFYNSLETQNYIVARAVDGVSKGNLHFDNQP